jgi:hypothetical protein
MMTRQMLDSALTRNMPLWYAAQNSACLPLGGFKGRVHWGA